MKIKLFDSFKNDLVYDRLNESMAIAKKALKDYGFGETDPNFSLMRTYKNLLTSRKIDPNSYDNFEQLDDAISTAIIRNEDLKFAKSFISKIISAIIIKADLKESNFNKTTANKLKKNKLI